MKKIEIGAFLFTLLAVTLVYVNHFDNAFHFDDSHAIENNVYIRNLQNIPLFFKDGSYFSSLPQNASYRPLISTSLALDYWMAGGYNLFYFHLNSFIAFVLQGFLMILFFKGLLSRMKGLELSSISIGLLSILASGIYLIHPANAETVNYIIARADIYSTLFVVMAFYLFQNVKWAQKYYIYLVPIILGALSKPTSVMFAPMLVWYVLLFEENIWKKLFAHAFPAMLLSLLLYFVFKHFTPDTYMTGGKSLYNYIITQPGVIAHYLGTFFLPVQLSADTDWLPLNDIWHIEFWIGIGVILALCVIMFFCAVKEELKPISFGLVWFFLALAPTSFVALSEVMNDHRLFYPYVGLVLSVCWSAYLLYRKYLSSKRLFNILSIGFISLVFFGFSYGTYERNEVWDNGFSLWKDVTVKSPKNGRGLMNYGVRMLSIAEYDTAEVYFKRAYDLNGKYYVLNTNMGVLYEAKKDFVKAESYHQLAIKYGYNFHTPWYYYGRFLKDRKRYDEAVQKLLQCINLSRSDLVARKLLLEVLLIKEDWNRMESLAVSSLKLDPNDTALQAFHRAALKKQGILDMEAERIAINPSREQYLSLSLKAYNLTNYKACIKYSLKAIEFDSKYASAYNNIAASYLMLNEYELAIKYADMAIKYDSKLQIAKNNKAEALRKLKEIIDMESVVTKSPTGKNYFDLGLYYYNKKMFRKSIQASLKSIELGYKPISKPYNNICAAYNELGLFKEAIMACEKALKSDPENNLARNNLNWSKKNLMDIK